MGENMKNPNEVVRAMGVLDFSLMRLKEELQKQGFKFPSLLLAGEIARKELVSVLPNDPRAYLELIEYNVKKIGDALEVSATKSAP